MRSTWHGLETAKRALFANQAALNTTGHNIANSSTPGYSRQRANFETTASLEYPGLTRSVEAGQLGTGVVVEGPAADERVGRRARLEAQGQSRRL